MLCFAESAPSIWTLRFNYTVRSTKEGTQKQAAWHSGSQDLADYQAICWLHLRTHILRTPYVDCSTCKFSGHAIPGAKLFSLQHCPQSYKLTPPMLLTTTVYGVDTPHRPTNTAYPIISQLKATGLALIASVEYPSDNMQIRLTF